MADLLSLLQWCLRSCESSLERPTLDFERVGSYESNGTQLVNRKFATRNAELARHPLPPFAIKHAYAHNATNLA